MYIDRLKQFLNETNMRYSAIENPEELIDRYFCIEEGGIIWVREDDGWELCYYLWKLPVDLDDTQNVLYSIRVIVRNKLKDLEDNQK